ncbi:xylulokinase [Georgenia sp. AZ-5]|uniref:xylulokinase n=1 Tax=Georgenia sp. AZ-5 TaxID=3367526 RepID=UPI003754C416
MAVGIDLGTTGVKVVAVRAATGETVASAAREYATLRPEPGAHEQDPERWWEEAAAACRTVTAVAGTDVTAVGLSGQMHTLVLVDGADRPVGRAMTWADRRVGEDTARLAADRRFRNLGGNDPVDAFTAPKLAWVARTQPERLARAARIAMAKDFVRFRLTGTWATDTTDAIGTLLYDVRSGRWSEELWEAVGASPGLAPPVASPTDVVGAVTAEAASVTGLPVGTPVAAGSGDVPAAVVGAGAVHRDQICLNVGTAAQVMGLAPGPDPGPGFLFGAAIGNEFIVMASLYAAGASVRWAARTFTDGAADDAAARAPAGAGGLTYLPFMFGATVPRKDDRARAAFLGQQEQHGRDHLVRAVLEGVAYGCADAVGAVAGIVGPPREVRLVGGVSASEIFREALASVLDARVVRVPEGGSARGAALLGLLAVTPGGAAEPLLAAGSPVEPATGETHRAYREAYARYRGAATRLLGAPAAPP